MLERVRNALRMKPRMRSEGTSVEDANARFMDRFVVFEFGGHMRALLNSLSIPEERKPLYIAGDYRKDELHRRPKDEAPSAAAMQTDFTDERFLGSRTLDGSIDRFIAFNVFAVLTAKTRILNLAIGKIARMLKPGGKVIIGEWYTPDWADSLQMADFKSHGLEDRYVRGEEEIHALFSEFGVSKERIDSIISRLKQERGSGSGSGKPFLMVLTKKADAA